MSTDDRLTGEGLTEQATHRATTTTHSRWDLGSVLATAAGIALAVLGAVVLVRTGINETWYSPVEEVAGIRHTPLLGIIELGVGVLLILAGLAGNNLLAAIIAFGAAIAAAVVAIDTDRFREELGMEQWWATTLAIVGGVLALLLLATRAVRHHRTVDTGTYRTA
jgi:uncharacterized membrane protein HdeD (DUF308 family)